MSGFYVSMIFLGMLLIIVSLISIFLDKRKVFNFIKGFEEKKQELSEIIVDAEQMIDELNRFSDYIVTQMDLKNEELNRNLRDAEMRVHSLNERINTVNASAAVVHEAEAAVISTEIDLMETEIAYAVNSTSMNTGAINSLPLSTPVAASAAYNRGEALKSTTSVKKSDKVIPFNSRYSEVLRLAGEGLGSLDIARKLHMGKGEVELIIGLRK